MVRPPSSIRERVCLQLISAAFSTYECRLSPPRAWTDISDLSTLKALGIREASVNLPTSVSDIAQQGSSLTLSDHRRGSRCSHPVHPFRCPLQLPARGCDISRRDGQKVRSDTRRRLISQIYRRHRCQNRFHDTFQTGTSIVRAAHTEIMTKCMYNIETSSSSLPQSPFEPPSSLQLL